LADCEACRGIVVSLTQAAGAANRLEVPEQKGGASFWQKLSALFSPPVLRYAVPALVLIAVLGIGLLALRQQPSGALVAQNEPRTAAIPSTQTDSAPAHNPTPQLETRNGVEPATGVQRGMVSDSLDEPKKLEDKKVAELMPEGTVSKTGPAKDSASTVDGASVAQSQPSYAYEPKPVAPPPVASKVFDAEKSRELAKEQPAKREDRSRDQDETFRNEADDVHGPNRSRSNNAPATSQRGAGLMGGRGPSGMDKSKKPADVETRTVMGRQFRREGDAWVDVAYDPSRATVRVTRGSDQFRALIADEPGIRTIAEQLNGVVVVVWKGRAYRIQ
jgi:hypothetical protein